MSRSQARLFVKVHEGCVSRLCAEGVCRGCASRLCVELCIEFLCRGSVSRVCVEAVRQSCVIKYEIGEV